MKVLLATHIDDWKVALLQAGSFFQNEAFADHIDKMLSFPLDPWILRKVPLLITFQKFRFHWQNLKSKKLQTQSGITGGTEGDFD